MEKRDHLFELIESLSKSEKGYFKKVNSFHVKGGQNAYMKIFQVLDKMEKYDEQKIVQNLSPKDVKQLPYLKFYLYERILDSLDQYYQSSSVIVNKLICKADILFNKGLKQQSYKLLERARLHAQSHEKFAHYLALIRIEEEYLFEEDDRKVAHLHLKRLQQELSSIKNKYENLIEYLKLKNEVATYLTRNGPARSREGADEMRAFLNHPMLSDEHLPLSLMALFHFYVMKSYLYLGLREYTASYHNINFACVLINRHKEIFAEFFNEQIQTSYSRGSIAIAMLNFEEVRKEISHLRELKTTFESHRFEIFLRSAHLELMMLSATGKFDEALSVAVRFEERWKGWHTPVSKLSEIRVISVISQLYFILGKYEQALEWNNQVSNGPFVQGAMDLICTSKILELFILTASENIRMLKPKINSAKKFLQSKNRLFPFEKLLLLFFRKYVQHNPEQRSAIIDEAYHILQNYIKAHPEYIPAESGYILAWFESTLTERPLAIVVKNQLSNSEGWSDAKFLKIKRGKQLFN